MSSVSQMLEEKIQAMKMENNYYEVGGSSASAKTILDVSGLEGAFYFEKVRIADKAEGYVESISADGSRSADAD